MEGRSRRHRELESSREFAQALGRAIKVLRTDLGLERRELAERAGISYSYLTEIENGNKPPSSSVLRPIAHALGLRLSELTEAAEARMDARLAEARLTEAQLADARLSDARPTDAQLAYDQRAERSSLERDAVFQTTASTARERRPAETHLPQTGRPPTSGPAVGSSASILADFSASDWALRPSLRGRDRRLRGALIELERLLQHMDPDDVERLLDLARRLAR